MAKVGTFKTGFVDELSGKANRDGVRSFNLENLLGTVVHGAVGFLTGRIIRNAVKPDYKPLIKRANIGGKN